MHNNIMAAGPYTPTIITTPAVLATEDSPAVHEQTTIETVMNMTPENRAHFESEKEAIHLILTGIGDEIYSTVDACQTAQEMWEAIERLQQGESLNIQDVKTNLFWEFGQFTSHDGETIESYYTRFYKMMNGMIRNNLTFAMMQVNVQFLQQLQPEWSRFEVNELRAERMAKNANPLALVATAQTLQDPYYQTSKPHKSYAPTSKASLPTRSHATTRYKGKEIAKPITPPSESASEEDSDPEQAQRDKDMQKNLALIAKYFKKLYKPTNNNLRTSSNTRNKNVDTTPRYKNDNQTGQFGNQRAVNVVGARETVGGPVVQQSGIQCFNCKEFGHYAKECRKPKRVKDSTYHKEKMLLCKQAEKGVQLQAEQSDWLADTDEEIDEQELEAHYSYMAKIQEVPNADSGTDAEPLEQVQYDTDDNVFANDIQHFDQSESISNTCAVETAGVQSSLFEVPTAQSCSTASGQVTTTSTEINDDDIEEMDIKWNMALLSMRADRFWKKTGKKITVQGSDVAGFDKSKVECFNCHKLGHFARECRALRSQDRSKRESYKKEPKVEESSHKAMMAIDGIGWDWSFIAEENEASENQALVVEENTENLTTKISKLREELFNSESDLCNYKRGLSQVEARLVEFKINESKFYENIRVLERDLELKDDKIEYLTNELEEVKKERDGIDSKLEKFVNSSKNLDQMLETQRSVKDKTGLGLNEYSVVPPPPAQIYPSPMPDLSWIGLLEFADNTVTNYTRPTPSVDVTNDVRGELDGNNLTAYEHGGTSSNVVTKPIINFVKDSNVRSNNFGPPIIEDWDSEDESDSESTPIVSIKPTINQNRDQPRGNQRNWNNLKSQQPGKDFVMQNKACFKCGSFEHLKVNCNKINPTAKPTVIAAKGNKGKAVKASARWIWKPKKIFGEGSNVNGVSVTFKKYQYIDTQGRLKDFKLEDDRHVLLRTPRQQNMYVVDLKDIVPSKFDAKGDEGFFIGYSLNSKAFRVYNKRTKHIEENLHINFLESKVIDKAGGPYWLFDIESLTKFMNYIPVIGAGTSSSNISGTKEDVKKKSGGILIDSPQKEQEEVHKDQDISKQVEHEVNKEVPKSSGITFPTASSKESSKLPSIPIVETIVPTVSIHVPTNRENIFTIDPSEPPSTPTVESTVPTVSTPVPTVIKFRGGLRYSQPPSIYNAVSSENRVEDFFGDSTHATRLNEVEADLRNIETTIQVSPTPTLRIHKDHPKNQIIEEPKKISEALKDSSWVEAMQEELLQFQIQNVWVLVDCPKGPLGFQDPQFPHKVYKVVKAMYGLHQAPRAWKHKGEFLLVQVYVDDIIFGSSNPKLCREFEALMHDKFKMSAMGELSFFLGLQVLQKKDGIFLSQDKYVGDILKKFGFSDLRSANTLMDREHPWGKDGTSKDVDLHLYRSMIGSLMYLTASRPDIMFVVCTCARHQVTPKECHLHAVKRIFRYLKGHPKLGLWYPKESPFDLVAYSDSDYGGASQDRKSTTGGCQFLGRRLISWQCKKQTIVATSTTEAEYVAAASGCGQVLWIQNQLLDYGYNFMNTKIYIDNNSAICIVKNPVFHSRTKHIEIRHHFIRDCFEKKLIYVDHIHTDDNVADLLTKAFDVGRFQYLVVSIGMLDP
ncbi:putative ribonuclease H-like domain-containing protein [Tanacetum coccineum]